MIRAILFDLDGVLVDAANWHYQALDQALQIFGYSISSSDHERSYNGLPTSVKLQQLSRRTSFPIALHPFVNELKQKFTRTYFEKHCRPNSSITALLQTLQRQGYRLGCASNSCRKTVDQALKGMEIEHLFEVILSHEDVGVPKPDSAIYQECFRRLGLSAAETLIIEDSEPGIRAARDSGAHVMTVTDPKQVTLDRILDQVHELIPAAPENAESPTIEILIPMAGRGQRFVDAGFNRPKPFISVLGRPMIEWVVENVRPKQPHVFTFLVAEDHLRNEAYSSLLRRIAPGCRIVPVPALTEGATCTALLAADKWNPKWPLLIVNSDQWVDFDCNAFLSKAIASEWEGSILTFPATDEKWSYAKVDQQGCVTEVAEKRPISEHATVGIYYFKTAGNFLEAALQQIRSNERTRNEFYLCPVYNQVIEKGGRVSIFPLPADAMRGLGTPEDLEAFLKFQMEKPSPAIGNPHV